MSKATKRKYVTKEVLDDYILPEESQHIVKVLSSCGNNLHQVVTSDNQKYLVSMPTKFRRNVWIKKDDFVIVEPIEEGDKVKAEIVTILYKDQIKYIKDNNMWPDAFQQKSKLHSSQIDEDMLPPNSDSDSDASEDNSQQVCNPNRSVMRLESPDTSEEENDE